MCSSLVADIICDTWFIVALRMALGVLIDRMSLWTPVYPSAYTVIPWDSKVILLTNRVGGVALNFTTALHVAHAL